jgi:taurine transport system permease protein
MPVAASGRPFSLRRGIAAGRIAGRGCFLAVVERTRGLAANAGIGRLVLNASNFLRTDVVIMRILTIGVLACIFEFGMRRLEHVLVPWKRKV